MRSTEKPATAARPTQEEPGVDAIFSGVLKNKAWRFEQRYLWEISASLTLPAGWRYDVLRLSQIPRSISHIQRQETELGSVLRRKRDC
jgi:hypothetical protein